MDRNRGDQQQSNQSTVALRKESVDRNNGRLRAVQNAKMSLSARRAWIEIGLSFARKIRYVSLSARRAWIEIIDYIIDYVNDASRSPQGERG